MAANSTGTTAPTEQDTKAVREVVAHVLTDENLNRKYASSCMRVIDYWDGLQNLPQKDAQGTEHGTSKLRDQLQFTERQLLNPVEFSFWRDSNDSRLRRSWISLDNRRTAYDLLLIDTGGGQSDRKTISTNLRNWAASQAANNLIFTDKVPVGVLTDKDSAAHKSQKDPPTASGSGASTSGSGQYVLRPRQA